MSWLQIKSRLNTWFGSLAGLPIDWRVRWAVILLPLFSLVLLLMVIRIVQLGNSADAQSQLLRADWQSYQGVTDSGDSVQGLELLQPTANSTGQLQKAGLQELAELAVTLRRWLEQGRNTGAPVRRAAILVQQISVLRSGTTANLASIDFWQPLAHSLDELERSVTQGDITTPEARALIAELRAQQLYLSNLALLADPNLPIATADNTGAIPRFNSSASDRLGAVQDRHTALIRIAGWTAGLALLTLALVCGLLFGLWRTQQQRASFDDGEARREQSAILRLLDEMTPLASGDLRVNASVTEAMTGALADAFNYAVTELRWLVRAVTESADKVKSAVVETRRSTQELAQASTVQAREIHRSSNYLNVMSDTMAQLSAHAAESSRIADTSVEQAQAGALAVKVTAEALARINEQADMTTRLMQRLVESSAKINERVADITDLARRTDLLALNSTIRAAANAEQTATDDLSRLADDVAQLADGLNVATRDITGLTEVIHQDASLTMSSMAQTTAELDAGLQQAGQASASLDAIAVVSRELRGLINDIAAKTLRQAGVVKQLSANMGVINGITRESTLGLQASAVALEELHDMAAELRQGVSGFHLPAVPVAMPNVSAAGRKLASVAQSDADGSDTTESVARVSRA